jgi:aminopeptidase N
MKRSFKIIGVSMLLFVAIAGCNVKKGTATADVKDTAGTGNGTEIAENVLFDEPPMPVAEPENDEPPIRKVYRETRKRDIDVLHMKLEVSFEWKKHRMNGKAWLDVKPYFYPLKTASLDAKGYFIHKVAIVEKGVMKPLNYDYSDSMMLHIDLGKEYNRTDKMQLYIEYTARPDEFTAGGSAAISSDKGLYFINSDSSEAGKPTQIWTQGETEANSRWFPTIDSPNEKITQEIYITVDNKYKTLSNGKLVNSKKNSDGTRTDCWKQDLPHAPYLAMMAIGDFAVVKDTWTRSNGQMMEVNYYVEKEFERDAKAIFGDTPEMLTHFSKLLGVEYPWDKYHQVIVRDYVSGAMENTSAVIHGEFFNQTRRELLDNNNFSTIAHELFHHWFGDLVTCESWSNLPLNESFANYSQYLWDEYKYGRDEADFQAESEMMGYIYTAQQSGYVDMIRYDYGSREEMFDGNSYNKGGRILHMLRKYLGDEAFFGGLKLYLETNKFKAAEIDHLRLAFEEVSGEDLHWFFNQWFLNKGHADLEFSQNWSDGKLTITINQKQDFKQVPLYLLPVDIDVYVNGKATRHRFMAGDVVSEFVIETQKPELVVIDAEHCLLAEITEIKPHEQYIAQYSLSKHYFDRKEAVEKCGKKTDEASVDVVIKALNDSFWGIRTLALKNLRKAMRSGRKDEIKEKIKGLAVKDPVSSVRVAALLFLEKEYGVNEELNPLYQNALKDSSYAVMATGLDIVAETDLKAALKLAEQYQNERSSALRSVIAGIYSKSGDVKYQDFFLNNLNKMGGFEKIGFVKTYVRYVKTLDYKESERVIPILESTASNGGSMWMKVFAGYQELQSLQVYFEEEAARNKENGDELRAADAEKRAGMIKEKISNLLAKETDPSVLQFMRE